MKKLIIFLFFTVALTAAFAGHASAFDGEEESDGLRGYLGSGGAEITDGAKSAEGYQLNRGVSVLLDRAAKLLPGVLKQGLAGAAKLFAVALLAGMAGAMTEDLGGVSPLVLNAAGALCVVSVGAAEVNSVLAGAGGFLNDMNVFSKALLPTLTAAAAAAGAPAAAISRQTIAALFSDLIVSFIARLFVPAVFAYIALRTVSLVSENKMLARLSGLVKTAAVNTLKYMLVIYFAYISLSGLIGSAADSLGGKALKAAVSTAVPVVGGMVSEAAGAVLAGAAMVRNALGIFGVLGALGMALYPALSAGINYLLLKLAAALSGAAGETAAAEAVDILAEAMGLLFAAVVSVFAMLLITIVSCMKTAGM